MDKENIITINEETIRLDSFLKLTGALDTGGRAKIVIQQGVVLLNGEVCIQRSKKIKEGDRVRFSGVEYVCHRTGV